MTRTGFAMVTRFSASKSGQPSNDDQLTLISRISPNRADKAPISSGSSRATEALCGHHAPSRPSPSWMAKLSRTGLARRRPDTAPFMVLSRLSSTKSASLPGDECMSLGGPSTIPSLRGSPGTRVRDRRTNPIAIGMGGQLHALRSPWLQNRSTSTLHRARCTDTFARVEGVRLPTSMTRPIQRRQGEQDEAIPDCSCYLEAGCFSYIHSE